METTANTGTLHALREILLPQGAAPAPAPLYRVSIRDEDTPAAPWHEPIAPAVPPFPSHLFPPLV